MKQLLTLIAAKLPAGTIQQIIGRIGTSSPAFFKKIQAICLTLTGVFTAAIIVLKSNPAIVPHSEEWCMVLEFLIAFSLGSGGAASLPTTDPKYMGGDTKGAAIREAVEKGETPDLH